ncbi:hypothetical protein IEQ34_004875 [Dendrobium chrysotoxum]|uniref:Probable zinc-ribbon domain-containing protein n=1 Tax=Dendrobium chrysotoxum TaxID=161865 RepID=A0AAV7H716_DENCH|nr:hypothetical protein IEQ34_004875 [Dendrobium chrysotoxum]
MPFSDAAKVRSSSGEILSSASAAGSSKHISDSGSQGNQKENFEKQTPSSLDHPEDQDQALTESLKVSGSSGERNVEEASRNGMKTKVSDSYGGSLKDKAKSPVQENNGIKGITLEKENRPEQGIPSKVKNTLNEELKTSSDQEIPAANNSLKSSDKLEESPESCEHDTSSEDNKINGKFRMNSSFLLRSSSHAYEGSDDSTDEERRKQIPQKYLELSRRTFGKRTSSVFSGKATSRDGVQARERDFSFFSEDFKSALNWMESEKEAPSICKSKDTKHFANLRYSEKDDKVKIIRKVDELKSELLDFFHRSANAKDNSRLGLTAHFEGKIPPKQYRSSSLIPLSAQPNSSCLNPHHGGICCHNEHCRLCPHKACCRLPESTTSHPLHMKRCPSHHEPQNLQSNDKKPQPVNKRHCRPVSGGAPFVICYRCYKLLQLPADFLVSTKRIHKLRCGSCHEVLRYFFRARTRSMPWTPAEARHPPSEEEKNKVLNDEIKIPVSNGLSGGDPVSYSEDYGISFGQSYSYEAEPSRHLQRYDSIVEEEHSGKELRSSQLHKLMGYSSARYLLFETLSPGEGHRIGHDR